MAIKKQTTEKLREIESRRIKRGKKPIRSTIEETAYAVSSIASIVSATAEMVENELFCLKAEQELEILDRLNELY